MTPILTALLWMMGALASFTLMAISGRELSAELNTFQILAYRSAVGVLVASALISVYGWGQVRGIKFKMHLFRNVIHFAAQYGWFYGLAVISLTEVFAIEFTVPIWTAILAMLFLGERVTLLRLIAIGLGFIGVLIVLRPGVSEVGIASLAVLGAAVGYAAAHTTTRFLTQHDSVLAIIFYMSVIQLPLGVIPALDGWVWPSTAMWGWVAVVGVSGLSAHYALARALKLADASVVVPMDFMRLPLVAVVGYLVYGEIIDVWVGVGAAIICIGIYINLRDAARRTG